MFPRAQPDAAESDGPRIEPAEIERLVAGSEDGWRRFLVEYHAVFVRSLRGAAWRIFRGSTPISSEALVDLTDEAKTYFYQAFRRSFRGYEGEGRFRAFLFRTIQNFLMERFRARRHELALPDGVEDGDDRSIAVVDGPSDDERLIALRRCIERLAPRYRTVVLLQLEAKERSLSALAQTLGMSVDAVHKRHQRALSSLRECMRRRDGGHRES